MRIHGRITTFWENRWTKLCLSKRSSTSEHTVPKGHSIRKTTSISKKTDWCTGQWVLPLKKLSLSTDVRRTIHTNPAWKQELFQIVNRKKCKFLLVMWITQKICFQHCEISIYAWFIYSPGMACDTTCLADNVRLVVSIDLYCWIPWIDAVHHDESTHVSLLSEMWCKVPS